LLIKYRIRTCSSQNAAPKLALRPTWPLIQ
jgi:hypothetical protein